MAGVRIPVRAFDRSAPFSLLCVLCAFVVSLSPISSGGAIAEAAGGCVEGEVVDHLEDGLLDGRLPVVPVPGAGGGPGLGEDQAAGVVDDRAEAVGVEGGRDVAGRASLGAVARDE